MNGRTRAAVVLAALSGSVALAAAGQAVQPGPGDGPLGRGPVVRATAQNDAPARAYEPPTLLIHPRDPDTVVAGTIELSSGTCQLLRSTDGGATWALLDRTPSPADFPLCFRGGVYGYLNETPLAWGGDGALYWGINGLHPTRVDRDVSVLVARSADLGNTWSSTVVADGRAATVDPSFVSRPVTGLAVHARPGQPDTVYVGWQTYPPSGPRLSVISVSTDGGRTFSAPRPPYDARQSAHWGGEPGLEGLPSTIRVAADGTLYVLFPGRSADTSIPHRLFMAKSRDRGETFTVTEIAQPVEANSTPTFQWWPEGGPEGSLHVVWEDTRDGEPLGHKDIYYARSVDGGQTFSPPRRLTDDDQRRKLSQFNPNLSIAPNGRLDVVWWDFRDGAGEYANDVYYTYSSDQGLTWSPNYRVTDRSIDRKVGTWSNNFDYRAPPSVASLDHTVLVAWDDTRLADEVAPAQDIFTASVQLAALPADRSALPYAVAAVGGLVAAGVALVVIAATMNRRRPVPVAADRAVPAAEGAAP